MRQAHAEQDLKPQCMCLDIITLVETKIDMHNNTGLLDNFRRSVALTAGHVHAGALPLCASAADGDAGFWRTVSSGCQQISNSGETFHSSVCTTLVMSFYCTA